MNSGIRAAIALYVVPLLMVLTLAGCFMNDNGATASMHRSDNQAATEQHRIEARTAQVQAQAAARVAAAEAAARAEVARAAELTNRQRLDELGAAERLYSQQNYLIAKQSEGTNRMVMVMGFTLVLIVVAGGAWLFLFMRQNPQPVPRQVQRLEYLQPVPYALLNSQRAIEVGWQIGQDEFGKTIGQRTKNNGVVQRVNLLEDKR